MIESSLCKEWHHRMYERAIPSSYEKDNMEESNLSDCMKNQLKYDAVFVFLRRINR